MSGILADLYFGSEHTWRRSLDIATDRSEAKATSERLADKLPTVDRVGTCRSPGATRTVVSGDIRIDNREELRRRLGQLHTASDESTSDGELVALCYNAWGTNAFALLVGDFAFVLWDCEARRLFCVRDPLGMRPLFFRCDSCRLLVSAEIKHLFRHDASLKRELSATSAGAYLAGCRSDPEATFYEGIRRLPPGHWFAATHDGAVRVGQYWDAANIPLIRHKSIDDCAEDFRDRFLESVRARLDSRSRIGLQVSGGFDSSAVVAATHYWNERMGYGLRTWAFTNIARQPAADEQTYMDIVLARFPMERTTTMAEDFWAFRAESEPMMVRDEPYLAPYFARFVYELESARQRGIQVLLSGVGGDEIGGSSMYLIDALFKGRVFQFFPELKARAAGKHQTARALADNLIRALAGWLVRRVVSQPIRFPAWLSLPFARRMKGQLGRITSKHSYWNPAREHLYRTLEFCLTEPLISQAHQTARQFGVEVRHPFLDRRLFEWALSTQPLLFGENGCVKAPMRRALADMLPPAIVKRRDKGRYRHYFDLGLREKERARIVELLKAPISAELGFVEPEILRTAYDDYCNGGRIHRGQLWSWVTLEQWLRQLNL